MQGCRLEIRNSYSLLPYYHMLDNLRYWLPTYPRTQLAIYLITDVYTFLTKQLTN